MNTTTPGIPSVSFRGSIWLISTLLIATGCAQTPDIRSSRDGTSGVIVGGNPEYLSCVKADIRQDARTFIQEEDGKTLLFVGSTDPTTASGLVELSNTQGPGRYAVYQRHAWQDKGRLINAARACART